MRLLPWRRLPDVLRRTVREVLADDVAMLSAALSYYALLSLVPLLLLIVTTSSFLFDAATVRALLLRQIGELAPGETAQAIADLVGAALTAPPGGSTLAATLLGLTALLWSASGVFGTLDRAINRAWDSEYKTHIITARLISFLMVGAAAGILLLSLLSSAALVLVEAWAGELITGVGVDVALLAPLWRLLNIATALALGLVVLTTIYRTIPRRRVRVHEVWPGALLTAVAIEICKQGFAYYLGSFAHRASLYGTFGTLFSLITWLYLTTFIFLVGAEFTAEYTAVLRADQELPDDVPPTQIEA